MNLLVIRFAPVIALILAAAAPLATAVAGADEVSHIGKATRPWPRRSRNPHLPEIASSNSANWPAGVISGRMSCSKTPGASIPVSASFFGTSKTGTVIWKMSHNPGYNLHTYSNLRVWNIDGSRLLLHQHSSGPRAIGSWPRTTAAGRQLLWTPDGFAGAN